MVRVDGEAEDYSREEALPWILRRASIDYISDWVDYIGSISLEAIPKEAVSSSLRSAAKEVSESDHILQPTSFPDISGLVERGHNFMKIRGLKLYELAPTEVIVWEVDCSLYYFELHWES